MCLQAQSVFAVLEHLPGLRDCCSWVFSNFSGEKGLKIQGVRDSSVCFQNEGEVKCAEALKKEDNIFGANSLQYPIR
jgi:hypothetical protein